MNWSKIKHKRKFKRYLLSVSRDLSNNEIQKKIIELITNKNLNVSFYAKPADEAYTLLVSVCVEKENLFLVHGFEVYDSIEKDKIAGVRYYSSFVTFFDLYRGGESIENLPEYLEEFMK